MYSGKTTELMRQCKSLLSINKKVLVVNHKFDSRCKDAIKSHDNHTLKALKVKNLAEIDEKLIEEHDVIAIDEAQFFGDLLSFVKFYETKDIIVAGLSGDYKRNKFGQVVDLIPYADNVQKLSAYCKICNDGTLAHFTKRTTSNSELVLIGAQDDYIAVCRKHYLNDYPI